MDGSFLNWLFSTDTLQQQWEQEMRLARLARSVGNTAAEKAHLDKAAALAKTLQANSQAAVETFDTAAAPVEAVSDAVGAVVDNVTGLVAKPVGALLIAAALIFLATRGKGG